MLASLLKEGEAGIVRIVADIRKWQPGVFGAGCRALGQGIEAMTSQTGRTARPALVGAEPQLFVADIKASCDFFTQKLGFSIVFVYGEPPFYAQVKRDRGLINLKCMDRPVIDPALRDRESLLSSDMGVGTADEIKQLFLEF